MREQFQAAVLYDLSSLMTYLEYLKRCLWPMSMITRWPETSSQLRDRVLVGLSQPVGRAFTPD